VNDVIRQQQRGSNYNSRPYVAPLPYSSLSIDW